MESTMFRDSVHAELLALRELVIALLVEEARRSPDPRSKLASMLDLIERRISAYRPPTGDQARDERIRERAISAVQAIMGEIRLD